jgi:Acetyltransferase (GNAT) domain
MTRKVEIIPWEESPVLVDKLRESARTSSNFRAWMQMPEWVRFHWKPFVNTYVAAARDAHSGVLLGVTPLVEKDYLLQFSAAGRKLGTIRIRGLLLNGNIPLFPPSDEYYEALCRAALTMRTIDCLYMLGVPKSSPFWLFLTRARTAYPEWLFYIPYFDSSQYAYIDMSITYDEYLRKFKAKTLQTFRNKRRRLEKHLGGKLELVPIRSSTDVAQFLPPALAIARNSWQRQLIEIDVDQTSNRQEFLDSVAGQGMLRSYLLRSGKTNLAYLVGVQLNGVFYFHETAFDEAYSRFSPGLLLLFLIIKDCFQVDKPSIFHFGTGVSGYKTLLANRTGEEVTILILKNSFSNQVKVGVHRLFRKVVRIVKSRMVVEPVKQEWP